MWLLSKSVLFAALLFVSLGQELNQSSVTVAKCCEVDSILVEATFGVRNCRKRSELLHIDLRLSRTKWEPAFYEDGLEVIGPKTIALQIGVPKCDPHLGEFIFGVKHARRSDDEFRLLTNGSMTHRLVHSDKKVSKTVLYGRDKYCIDDLIITHNHTLNEGNLMLGNSAMYQMGSI